MILIVPKSVRGFEACRMRSLAQWAERAGDGEAITRNEILFEGENVFFQVPPITERGLYHLHELGKTFGDYQLLGYGESVHRSLAPGFENSNQETALEVGLRIASRACDLSSAFFVRI